MNARAIHAGLIFWLLALALALAAGCGSAQDPGDTTPRPPDRAATDDDVEVIRVLRGQATYYADRFHGRTTASGERFDQGALTAAHRRLPFGTRVRVTNLHNDATVVVRINDRGPFGNRRRIIDLSRAAAERIGMIQAGVVPVEVEVLAD